jgi:hypothetical protein
MNFIINYSLISLLKISFMKKKMPSPILPDETLISKIYLIRKQKVMLDKDLAVLYGVKPIRLREQVKRNLGRFPGRFMFQLAENEIAAMVSQNAIPSRRSLGGAQPYVFTEHGVLMLANVLKSKQAIAVSLRLVDLFIRMREMLAGNKEIMLKLEELEKRITGNEREIQMIFSALKKLLNPAPVNRPRIGFRRNNQKD